MLIGVVLAGLVSGLDGMPDPYLGASFQLHPNKYSMIVDDNGDPEEVVTKRRRKLLQLGVPIEINKFSWGDAESLSLVATPEILFSHEFFAMNASVGIEQDLPFTNYRAFPSALFWGIGGGAHYAFVIDRKDYLNGNGRALSLVDRTSLAALAKFYFGPRFMINRSMDLKLRLSWDWMFGMIGEYSTRTNLSSAVGSVFGFQVQIDFR